MTTWYIMQSMEITELSPIEQEIVKALESLGEKSRFSEAVLAKKIRDTAGIDGKKKAGIGLINLENAIEFLESQQKGLYAIIMNSANDLLIEKTQESRPLSQDAHSRRLKSEKSMSIFTNGDLNQKKQSKPKQKIRTQRKSLNVNQNFDDYDE